MFEIQIEIVVLWVASQSAEDIMSEISPSGHDHWLALCPQSQLQVRGTTLGHGVVYLSAWFMKQSEGKQKLEQHVDRKIPYASAKDILLNTTSKHLL